MNLNYKAYFFLLWVGVLSHTLQGQNSSKTYKAHPIEEPIIIDGHLDEQAWKTAEVGGDFVQFFPTDSLAAQESTEFKVMYSSSTLYIGFRAQTTSRDPIVSSLKRDFSALTNDNVSILLDTFNDGNNAFFFGVTPYGVQREGLVSEGGNTFNNTWDIKWKAEAYRSADHYTVEIAIPFSSLKFVEGSQSWRFRPYRWNLKNNEQSTWVRVPQNQRLSSLAYMGELQFSNPLGKSRTPLAVIPYLNGFQENNFDTERLQSKVKFGGDLKLAIGDGLNLDLTINPDFSNVEVDDIFTNLTRFELRLPEKRQFFIDNNDLFDGFGNIFSGAKPFFSRRIGLAQDPSGALIQNDIEFGTRLSGKLNENWRLGWMSIQTAADSSNEIPSFNNAMAALQRKVGARSNVGVFFINKQATASEDYLTPNEKYNRVVGADYNLASADNTIRGRFYLHKSFQPGDQNGNLSSQAVFFYNPREWLIVTDLAFVDRDFRADLGFVPRTDIFRYGQAFQRIFYPKKGLLNTHRLMLLLLNDFKPSLDYFKTDHAYSLRYETEFRNLSQANLYISNNYTYLNTPFNPSGDQNSTPLPAQTEYYYNQVQFRYQSNNAKLLTYSTDLTWGQFFNGQLQSISTNLNYRIQPRANIGINLRYDGIQLPEPYGNAQLWLMSSRVEFTFNKKLFWNTLIQFRSQSDNLGINSRLQWRFAPLSDLYIVYNDNYFTSERWLPRFRSINLKLTYWLNL